jgi:hypothetical protein
MTIRFSATFALLLALAALCAGCNKPAKSHKPIAQSNIPAVLPASWPVPELTLPIGATICVLPFNIRGDGEGQYMWENVETVGRPSMTGKSWDIGFNFTYDWNQLISHVQSGILDAGYRCTEEAPLERITWASKRRFITYSNHDESVVITISYNQFAGDMLNDPYEGYCYSITTWK